MKKIKNNALKFIPQTQNIPYLTYMKHLSTLTLENDSIALIHLDIIDMEILSQKFLQNYFPETMEDFFNIKKQQPKYSINKLSLQKINHQIPFTIEFSHDNDKISLCFFNPLNFYSNQILFNGNFSEIYKENYKTIIDMFKNRLINFDNVYFHQYNNQHSITLSFIEKYNDLKEPFKRRVYTLSFTYDNVFIN